MLDSLTSTAVHSVQPGRAVLQQPPPPPPHLPLTSPSKAPSLHSTLAIFFPRLASLLLLVSPLLLFFLLLFFLPHFLPCPCPSPPPPAPPPQPLFFLSPCSLLSPLPPYFLTAPLYFLSLPTPTRIFYLAVISQHSGESCLFSIFFSFFISGSLH